MKFEIGFGNCLVCETATSTFRTSSSKRHKLTPSIGSQIRSLADHADKFLEQVCDGVCLPAEGLRGVVEPDEVHHAHDKLTLLHVLNSVWHLLVWVSLTSVVG